MSSVIDELDTLTRDRASGALKIEGEQRGNIYLDGGRFIFAEATGVPDLASRLIGSRWLTAEQWNALRTEGRPGEFGALLVERGIISERELLTILRSAFLDSVTALTVAGRSAELDVRFAPRERPWISSVLDFEVEALRSEVTRRAEHDFSPDARPRLSDLDRPLGIVERRLWVIACRIDGVTTLRDLAWRNGFALYETVESVHELVQAGLCTLPSPPPPKPETQTATSQPTQTQPTTAQTAQTQPTTAAQSQTAATAQSQTSTLQAAQTQAQPATQTQPATQRAAQTQAQSAAQTQPAAQTQTHAQPAAQTHAQTAAQTTHTRSATQAQPAAQTQTRTTAQTQTQAAAQAPAETQAQAETQGEDESLPRRQPGMTVWDHTPVETGLTRAQASRTMFATPTNEIMKRLLEGLRRMDD